MILTRVRPEELIIFVHILKTAGSTFGGIVWRACKEHDPVTCSSIVSGTLQLPGGPTEVGRVILAQDPIEKARDYLRKMPMELRKQVKFLGGHWPIGIDRVFPHPARYLTILREPVERMLSHYYFDAHMRKQRGQRRIPLELAIRSGYLKGNLQVYSLLTKQQRRDSRRIGLAQLNLVRETILNRFAVVGITERFDETLLMFQRAIGFGAAPYRRERVNRSRPARADLPRRIVTLLESKNEMDLILYEQVKRTFDEQVREGGSEFAKELAQFREISKQYAPHDWEPAVY